MPRRRHRRNAGVGLAVALLLMLWLDLAAASAQPIGRVDLLRGEASAGRDGEARRPLKNGDPVHQGERLATARDSLLKIRFIDDTDAYLGSDSAMTLDQFRAASEPEPSFAASIVKGVFRFATGLIGRARPAAVRIRIPTATIGIRGTHFAGEIDGGRAAVVLLDPAADGHANAIEVSNAFGAVVIEEAGYGTEIADAASAPSPPRLMRLRAVDNLLRSMNSIQRLGSPPRLPR